MTWPLVFRKRRKPFRRQLPALCNFCPNNCFFGKPAFWLDEAWPWIVDRLLYNLLPCCQTPSDLRQSEGHSSQRWRSAAAGRAPSTCWVTATCRHNVAINISLYLLFVWSMDSFQSLTSSFQYQGNKKEHLIDWLIDFKYHVSASHSNEINRLFKRKFQIFSFFQKTIWNNFLYVSLFF